jgi:quinol monooxygenase YgiN
MIIRIFDTAIDPDDVELAKETFRTEVRPAFDAFEGCRGISMHLGIDEHTADLVEVAAISTWTSVDDIERATSSGAYDEAMTDMRKLFQQSPLVRHFETVE